MGKANAVTSRAAFDVVKNAVDKKISFIDKNNGNRETELAGCFEFMDKNGDILICPIYKPDYGVVDQIISAIEINEASTFTISDNAIGKMYFNFDDFENFKNQFNENPELLYFYDNEQIGNFHITQQPAGTDWDFENIPMHAQWDIHGRQKTVNA